MEIHSNHCLHYSNSTDCTQKCGDVMRPAPIPLALTWVGQWHSPCKATYASIPAPSPSCPILFMIILHLGRNTGWESGSRNIRVHSIISPLNKLRHPSAAKVWKHKSSWVSLDLLLSDSLFVISFFKKYLLFTYYVPLLWQNVEDTPWVTTLLSQPCVESPPLKYKRTCDLLLINRTWQWWDVTHMIIEDVILAD